jgi:hypothetical protein
MEVHSARLVREMLFVIEEYLQGRVPFTRLVPGLEGLVQAADFRDETLKAWYRHWTPLEIRNAVAGDGVKREDVERELATMASFLSGLLT